MRLYLHLAICLHGTEFKLSKDTSLVRHRDYFTHCHIVTMLVLSYTQNRHFLQHLESYTISHSVWNYDYSSVIRSEVFHIDIVFIFQILEKKYLKNSIFLSCLSDLLVHTFSGFYIKWH